MMTGQKNIFLLQYNNARRAIVPVYADQILPDILYKIRSRSGLQQIPTKEASIARTYFFIRLDADFFAAFFAFLSNFSPSFWVRTFLAAFLGAGFR